MPTRSRVVGSGFSTLMFNGKVLAMLDSYVDGGQAPLSGPEPVYSIDNRYADEIVTSRVLAPGTLTVTIREAWHEPVWKYLLTQAGLTATEVAGLDSITDAYDALDPFDLVAQVVIKNPNPGGGHRGKVFHGLTLTTIDDGENVNVGALTIARTVSFSYVKATYFGGAATDPIPA